ncbi:MAG: 30S ribosomal protein S9 [archaeon]|nr:30S ribosomal protein S9 [archaeon]
MAEEIIETRVVEEVPEMVTESVDAKKKKKPVKSKKHGIRVKAKKKTAVARATIKTGKGRITVNKRPVNVIEPKYIRELIEEPILLAGKELINSVNIEVEVHGGGFMSQAVSSRATIAKALVEYSNDEKLKKKFLHYDRTLLVDDKRRKEAKKPLGRGARKKKQSSKR